MRNQASLALALVLATLILTVSVFADEVKISGGVIVEKVSNKPFAATDSRLQAAIKGARMVVIGEPNYQMMQRMVGRERRPSKAYFIFRPDLGIPIFDNDYAAAMEVPLKLLIYEREDKKIAIRYKKPSSVLADYKGLSDLGRQLDELIGNITDAAVK